MMVCSDRKECLPIAPVCLPAEVNKWEQYQREEGGEVLSDETGRELFYDSICQRVGHTKYLVVDVVEGCRIVAESALETRRRFLGRKSEVLVEHGEDSCLWPVRIGTAQKGRDVVSIGVPAPIRFGNFRIVACLRGGDQIHGDENVLLEEIGELRAGRGSIVGYDRVADVFLIAKQPSCRRRSARIICGRLHDVEPSPEDMIGPQLSHGVVELHG